MEVFSSVRHKDGDRRRKWVGQRITHYRVIRKMSQTTLAKEVGVSQGAISLWENGTGNISVNQLIILLNIFKIGGAEFFGELSTKLDPITELKKDNPKIPTEQLIGVGILKTLGEIAEYIRSEVYGDL